MSRLTLAFDLIPQAGGARACCAADLTALLPVRTANPHELIRTLKARDLITLAFVEHGQKFYVTAAEAVAPADARPIRSRAANKKNQARARAALARARRLAKRIARI
ncbi:MAG: hypothetical protein ABI790_02430 [Betaproteobacteria bacterium]